jgi:tRNA-Thr(GGU) m(6)t(6)A37 methyltransferase TsaA
MIIEPIAFFRSPLTSKFGLPRQCGVASELRGSIEFVAQYRHPEAVRGLESFSHLWLIWEFSANAHEAQGLTVRPPRLGGNERVGVFASRSPFRPNRLGLSAVEIESIDARVPIIYTKGADLMDGTPIYDIKPYVAFADSHPEARSGFVDTTAWTPLQVEIPETAAQHFDEATLLGLRQVLAQDPRPRFHDDEGRIYGMPFAGYDVRFRVVDGVVVVVEVV